MFCLRFSDSQRQFTIWNKHGGQQIILPLWTNTSTASSFKLTVPLIVKIPKDVKFVLRICPTIERAVSSNAAAPGIIWWCKPPHSPKSNYEYRVPNREAVGNILNYHSQRRHSATTPLSWSSRLHVGHNNKKNTSDWKSTDMQWVCIAGT